MQLLREAFGPHIRVEISEKVPVPHPAGQALAIDIAWPNVRKPYRLILQSWPANLTDLDTVWILPRKAAVQQAIRAVGGQFIDLGGAVHLRLPWLVVDRTDLKPALVSPPSRRLVDPFSDHNSLVIRTMLHAPHKAWGIRELALAAGVGRSVVSDIVRSLHEDDLVQTQQAGRSLQVTLPRPLSVIERWAMQYEWSQNTRLAVHAPMGTPHRFLNRLPKLLAHTRWALTLQSGASLLAPHATWTKAHVYLESTDRRDLERHALQLGWPGGDDGNLVLMAPRYRESIWPGITVAHRMSIVSLVQLMLDLWHYPLRGREQAEHLYETVYLPRSVRV